MIIKDSCGHLCTIRHKCVDGECYCSAYKYQCRKNRGHKGWHSDMVMFEWGRNVITAKEDNVELVKEIK